MNHSHPIEPPKKPGELVIIGSGIQCLGFQRSDEALIRNADDVFYCIADQPTKSWIHSLKPDAKDLAVFYENSKLRSVTYIQMAETMLEPVRKGRRVVGIFYGHPGFFATPPHRAVSIARREGYKAELRPGVSALDCLFADLNVDPAFPGLQSFEATDMLVHTRTIDNSLHVVLWQVGVVGQLDYNYSGFSNKHFPTLVEYLLNFYAPETRVTNYIGSAYATIPSTIEEFSLEELRNPKNLSNVTAISTFYIAPQKKHERNLALAKQFEMDSGQVIRMTTEEAKAALKDYSSPKEYDCPISIEANRFLVELQQDLALQRLYETDPQKALELFPRLSRNERILLASRDPAQIAFASRGELRFKGYRTPIN